MTDYNTYLEEALENIKSIFAHDYVEQLPIIQEETPAIDESITYDTPTASAADSTSSTGSYNGTSVTGSFNPLKYAQNFLTKWEGFVYTWDLNKNAGKNKGGLLQSTFDSWWNRTGHTKYSSKPNLRDLTMLQYSDIMMDIASHYKINKVKDPYIQGLLITIMWGSPALLINAIKDITKTGGKSIKDEDISKINSSDSKTTFTALKDSVKRNWLIKNPAWKKAWHHRLDCMLYGAFKTNSGKTVSII